MVSSNPANYAGTQLFSVVPEANNFLVVLNQQSGKHYCAVIFMRVLKAEQCQPVVTSATKKQSSLLVRELFGGWDQLCRLV